MKKLQPDALFKYPAFSYQLFSFSSPMIILAFLATRYETTQNTDLGMKKISKYSSH